LNFNKKYPTQI